MSALKTVRLSPVRMAQAVFAPTRRGYPSSPLRRLAKQPVVFDLWTTALQAKDLLFHKPDPGQEIGAYHDDVRAYNAGVTNAKKIVRTRRAEPVYEPLTLPRRDLRNEKLLIIGPRNVQELFIAWTFGFAWPNIQAIDLYSTNDKISVMNMEAMTFKDETFDAIASASTLAYAEDTFRALSEMARVLKPGGRLAFHAVHDPGAERWPESKRTGAEIAGYLRQLKMNIYYHSAVSKTNSESRRQTTHIFACQKLDPANPVEDVLVL